MPIPFDLEARKKKRLHRPLVPASIDGVPGLLGRMAKSSTEAEAIADEYNKQIAELQEEAAKKLAPHVEDARLCFKALRTFARSRRPSILPPDKKRLGFPNGYFGWRWTEGDLDIPDEEKALEILGRTDKAEQMIRQKPEINREALAEDPELMKLVDATKHRREKFYAKGDGMKKEISEAEPKKKKKNGK